MSDRVEQISKSELLNVIRSEHKRLEETLAQLSEDPMTQPGVAGEWSVKDILVHITAWEKRMVRWVGETLRGEVPETPAPGMTWDDLDKLNEQTYLENRNKPLGQVLADFHQSYQATMKVVEDTPEDDFVDPHRFPWRNGEPLWKTVAANTWWHYEEHRQSIRTWLEKLAIH